MYSFGYEIEKTDNGFYSFQQSLDLSMGLAARTRGNGKGIASHSSPLPGPLRKAGNRRDFLSLASQPDGTDSVHSKRGCMHMLERLSEGPAKNLGNEPSDRKRGLSSLKMLRDKRSQSMDITSRKETTPTVRKKLIGMSLQ